MHGAKAGRPPINGRQTAWERALGPTWRALKRAPVRDLDVNVTVFLARESELRERLATGDSPEWRAHAVDLLNELRRAGTGGDAAALQRAMTALETHLRQGSDRDGVWGHVLEIEERHARLVETATRIETAKENSMSGRALIGLLGTIFDLVMQEAGERAAYRVGLRFDKIIAEELPAGSAFPALPMLGAGGGEEPPEVSE